MKQLDIDSFIWQAVYIGMMLRREDGHVFWWALDFEVEGQRKKGRQKRTWKKQAEDVSMRVGLCRSDAHC